MPNRLQWWRDRLKIKTIQRVLIATALFSSLVLAILIWFWPTQNALLNHFGSVGPGIIRLPLVF
jgi:hypothetical protein